MDRAVRIEVQKALLSKGFLSVKDWSRERGFSQWLVYKVLDGVALNGEKGRRIVEALREDLGLDLLKLHGRTSSGCFSQDKGGRRGK